MRRRVVRGVDRRRLGVVLVHPDCETRGELRLAVESDGRLQVVGEAASARAAAALVEACHADVVLLDLGVPGDPLGFVTRVAPLTAVVVLEGPWDTVDAALALGARGVVAPADLGTLISALLAVRPVVAVR